MTTLEAGPAAGPRSGRLLQVLGVAFGLAVIVGNTIVVGILRTPGEVASHVPGALAFLAVWVAGGVFALFGAASLAELGAMVPRSGGQYVFVRRGLGDYPGFIVGWSDWISVCGSAAAGAIVFGEYLGVLVPALAPSAGLVATGVIVLLCSLQWRGIRWGDRIQQLLSAAKALALIALVAVVFALGGKAPEAEVTPGLPAGLAWFGAVMLALQGVIYTYDGWSGPLYFGEEVENPGRNIPRAMIGGVLTVIAIYLLLNLAFLYVVPMSRMVDEPFVAGVAAEAVFGPRGDVIIRSIMVLSVLGGVSAILLMAPRVPLAMARDRLLPEGMTAVNPGGSPTTAMLVSGGIALAFIATGTFEDVLALLAFFFVANYTLSLTALFVLRRTEPDTPRPYRAPLYPWIPGIALIGFAAFLAGQVVGDTRQSLWSLGLLAVSYPVYRMIRRPPR